MDARCLKILGKAVGSLMTIAAYSHQGKGRSHCVIVVVVFVLFLFASFGKYFDQTLQNLTAIVVVSQVNIGGIFERVRLGRDDFVDALFLELMANVPDQFWDQSVAGVIARFFHGGTGVSIIESATDAGYVFKLLYKERFHA